MVIAAIAVCCFYHIHSQSFCDDIKETKDQFTDEVTYSSPLLDVISFSKVLAKTDTFYFASLRAHASTGAFGKGVIILLEDGQKIEKPARVDITYESVSEGYMATAFIRLTSADLSKLSISKIKAFRLYIFDREDIARADAYREYVKCLVSK